MNKNTFFRHSVLEEDITTEVLRDECIVDALIEQSQKHNSKNIVEVDKDLKWYISTGSIKSPFRLL